MLLATVYGLLTGAIIWLIFHYGNDFPERPAEPDGPRGVRIMHADGRVTECSVVRDPEDKDGWPAWMAVPVRGPGLDAAKGDWLHADYVPPKTILSVPRVRDQP